MSFTGVYFIFFLLLQNLKMIITKFTSGLNVMRTVLLSLMHEPPIYRQKTFCAIIIQLWGLQCYQFPNQNSSVLYIPLILHFPKCIITLYLSKWIPLLWGNLLWHGIINQSCFICSNSAWQVILLHLSDQIHSECLSVWYHCTFTAS